MMRKFDSSSILITLAAFFSNTADGVAVVTFTIVSANEIVYEKDFVGQLLLAKSLAWVILTVPVGVLIDRLGPAPIAFLSQSLRIVILGLVTVVAFDSGLNPSLLICLALSIGIGEVAFDSAIPSLVQRSQFLVSLETTNSRVTASEVVGNDFLGPVAASLICTLSVGASLFCTALLFLFSAIVLCAFQLTRQVAAINVSDKSEGPSVTILQAVNFFVRSPQLLGLALLGATINIAIAADMAVLIYYLRHSLGMSDVFYGTMLTAAAGGGIAGAAFTPLITRWMGATISLRVLSALFAIQFLLRAYQPTTYSAIASLASLGFATSATNVISIAHRQRAIPATMFGRVNSFIRTGISGALPIGFLLGSFLITLLPVTRIYYALFALAVPFRRA